VHTFYVVAAHNALLTHNAPIVFPPNAPIPPIIYRSGRTNPGNMKPGSDGYISFRDSLSNPWPLEPGQRAVFPNGNDDYFSVPTSKLPPGSVIPDNVPPGHVSVKDVPPDVLKNAAKKGNFSKDFPAPKS